MTAVDNCTTKSKDGNSCDVCNVAYFKDTVKNMCSPCKENCTTCKSATDCSYCALDFQAKDNECITAKASVGVIAGVAIVTGIAFGTMLFMTWREIRKNKKFALENNEPRAGSLALD